MAANSPNLDELSRRLATKLETQHCRVVFAESCTGGLVSASLAQIPGISNWLCGSAVTYREATKSQWLSITPKDLASYTAVSEQIARKMAIGVLTVTDEADLAASVTGYLGPAAPEGSDGLVFVGLCRRQKDNQSLSVRVIRHQLSQPGRTARQREAACFVLQAVLDFV